LSQANPGAGVEGEENEGIVSQVLLEPVIEETFWVKLVGCVYLDD
jgi:hypothetical protein